MAQKLLPPLLQSTVQALLPPPDGPKVGTVTLSPRGDWRMPSDAVNALWAGELEEL